MSSDLEEFPDDPGPGNVTDVEEYSSPVHTAWTVALCLLCVLTSALYLLVARVLQVVAVQQRFGRPIHRDLHWRLFTISVFECGYHLGTIAATPFWLYAHPWRLGGFFCKILNATSYALDTMKPLLYTVLLAWLAIRRDSRHVVFWTLLSGALLISLIVFIIATVFTNVDHGYCGDYMLFTVLHIAWFFYDALLLLATIIILIIGCVRKPQTPSPPVDVTPNGTFIQSQKHARAVHVIAAISLPLTIAPRVIFTVLYEIHISTEGIFITYTLLPVLASIVQAIVICVKYPFFWYFVKVGFGGPKYQQMRTPEGLVLEPAASN